MSNKNLITFEEWVDSYTQDMVVEVLKSFNTYQDKIGAKEYQKILMRFLAVYIGTVVYKSLSAKSPSSFNKTEKYEFTHTNFKEAKRQVSEAVSLAFQAAITQWSGQEIDYYTQINPVPAAANKEPC